VMRPGRAGVYAGDPSAQDPDYAPIVRNAGVAIGALLVLGGVVWILQGFDVSFAPQSFMTGDPLWIVLGALAVVIGLLMLRAGWRQP